MNVNINKATQWESFSGTICQVCWRSLETLSGNLSQNPVWEPRWGHATKSWLINMHITIDNKDINIDIDYLYEDNPRIISYHSISKTQYL